MVNYFSLFALFCFGTFALRNTNGMHKLFKREDKAKFGGSSGGNIPVGRRKLKWMRNRNGNLRSNCTESTDELLPGHDQMFVENILSARQSKFTTIQSVNIFVTTFNVGGRSPPANLHDLIRGFNFNAATDLVVIGLQEMDLALGSYVKDKPQKENEWLQAMALSFPSRNDFNFRLVKSVRLVGIFLIVYCRTGITDERLSNVQVGTVPTGFSILKLGKLGNKGGVGISLRLDDTRICFVNSHLAAGANNKLQRNKDFHSISQMRFTNGYGLYDHDVVIWLGDLNYRLDIALTYDDVIRKIEQKQFDQLLLKDQLKEQQNLGNVFSGFMERKPSFMPTYKFDPGTHNWDTSEKKRVPAWCDRILYWTKDKENVGIEQLTYKSAHQVVLSDHKPVLSTFRLQLKKVDCQKRRAIYAQQLQKLKDKRQNDLLSQVSLSTTEFHFGTVHFGKPSLAVLTIQNTGHTQAHIRFFIRTETSMDGKMEHWLTINPLSSSIDVGASVEINLRVLCSNESICNVPNDGAAKLSAIVILHLDDGREYFVAVNAKYQRQ